MKLICKEARSRDEARDFILLCEERFDEKLRNAVYNAISRNSKIITVSGPTCSGKTTTSALLEELLEKAGKSTKVISIDDFYLDGLREKKNANGDFDFDSVSTIDLEYFATVVEKLLKGETVELPVFDFMTGNRSHTVTYTPSESDIFVFEGIQVVYPEVTEILGDNYTGIFICVTDDVMYNGIYFSSHEIRFLRRIVRDAKFRNTTAVETFEYWDNVRKNEENNIFPNAKNPHVLIDSFLTYELFVIAPLALQLIKTVPESNPHYDDAKSFILRLEKLVNPYYDTSFIPSDSMFREFIGK